jgi:hypothetical protein
MGQWEPVSRTRAREICIWAWRLQRPGRREAHLGSHHTHIEIDKINLKQRYKQQPYVYIFIG